MFTRSLAILLLTVLLSSLDLSRSGVNDKGYKCESTASSRVFVTHDSHVDQVTDLLEVVFDVILLGRIKNTAYKILNIDWIRLLLLWSFFCFSLVLTALLALS